MPRAVFAIVGLSIIGLAWCVLMLARNKAVGRYRQRTIDQIAEANTTSLNAAYAEVCRGNVNGWKKYEAIQAARWAWYDSISYAVMLHCPWKPLDSFYPPMPNEVEEWPNIITVDQPST